MDGRIPKHICFRTQCGICGRMLMAGVSFKSLLRSSDISTESLLCLDKEVFPGNSNNLPLHGGLLCWLANCWRCGRSPEAVGIHSDCFNLFKQDCDTEDALDRLWVAVVSRSPWRGAPNLGLDHDTNLAVELVYEKAEIYGIPRLKLLPPELIRAVRDFSHSGTFWRYISALNFGRELVAASVNESIPSPMTLTPLCDISAWMRGTKPTLLKSSEHPSFIRLTIDCRGIKLVERLPHRPPYQQWRSDNMVFAIQEESQLGNVTTQLKYDILRLELPRNDRGFHIWDMPNPPRLDDCGFSGHIAQSTRFRTIDLRGATGLTFLFSFSKVYAIHAHTSMMPNAKRTFYRLSQRRRANVAWLYLPIPKGEEIVSLAVRLRRSQGRLTAQKPCFLVRTKMAGDISLGPYHLGEHKDIVLSQLQPRLLIYNTADIGPATVFGTYSWEQHTSESFSPFHHPEFDSVPIHQANFSSAPLKDVIRIRVFYDEEFGFCRAIIFDYENGARRAVGNCRLGVDSVKTYWNPSRICYLSSSYSPARSSVVRQAVRVESGCDSTHDHDEDAWVCSAMERNLEFWFSDEESVMKVDVGGENQSN